MCLILPPYSFCLPSGVAWIIALTALLSLVNIGNARLFGLEEDLGMEGGSKFQLAVSVLFITYCVRRPSNYCLSASPGSRK